MDRRLILALGLLAIASPALAKEEKASADDSFVDISPVALPVIVNDRVVNYIFVGVRVDLTAPGKASAVRDHEPYIRDALVRAGRRTPFTRGDDYNRLDETKLKAVVFRETVALAGPGVVKSVTITKQQAQHQLARPGK